MPPVLEYGCQKTLRRERLLGSQRFSRCFLAIRTIHFNKRLLFILVIWPDDSLASFDFHGAKRINNPFVSSVVRPFGTPHFRRRAAICSILPTFVFASVYNKKITEEDYGLESYFGSPYLFDSRREK
jgi:hypothetical protein